MLQKLQSELLLAMSKTQKLQIRGMPRLMVYLFLCTVIFSVWLFLYAWCVSWKSTGKPDLAILATFVGVITSVSFIAAIGFFGKALIDNDDDGIPDEWENKNGKQ